MQNLDSIQTCQIQNLTTVNMQLLVVSHWSQQLLLYACFNSVQMWCDMTECLNVILNSTIPDPQALAENNKDTSFNMTCTYQVAVSKWWANVLNYFLMCVAVMRCQMTLATNHSRWTFVSCIENYYWALRFLHQHFHLLPVGRIYNAVSYPRKNLAAFSHLRCIFTSP